jgi:hypothetical protein
MRRMKEGNSREQKMREITLFGCIEKKKCISFIRIIGEDR